MRVVYFLLAAFSLIGCKGRDMEALPQSREPVMAATPAEPRLPFEVEGGAAPSVREVKEGLNAIKNLPPQEEGDERIARPYHVASVEGKFTMTGGEVIFTLSFGATMRAARVLRFVPMVKVHCAYDGHIIVGKQRFEVVQSRPFSGTLTFFKGVLPAGKGAKLPELLCQASFDYEKPLTGERAKDPAHYCLTGGGVTQTPCSFKRPAGGPDRVGVSHFLHKNKRLYFFLTRGERLSERDTVHLHFTPPRGPAVNHLLSAPLSVCGPLETIPTSLPFKYTGQVAIVVSGRPVLSGKTDLYARLCFRGGKVSPGVCPGSK